MGLDARPRMARLRIGEINSVTVVRALCVIVVAILVLYPLFWLVFGSFQKSLTGEGGLIFDAYINVFGSNFFGDVVYNTAVMVLGTTVLSVLFGVTMAWIVARTDTPYRTLLGLTALVPFITPPMVGAFAWSYLGSPNSGFINVFWRFITGSPDPLFDIYTQGGLILVMSLYLAPYVFLFTSIALENMDPTLENAAYMAGANPIKTTFLITIPLAMPAILSGALLVFIQAIGSFAIPAAIGMPGRIYVFVTQIYSYLLGVPPKFAEAAALSIPLLVLSGLALWAQIRAVGKGKMYTTVGGKAFRPRLVELGNWRYVALAFVGLYLVLSAVLPYMVIIYGTFIKDAGLAPIWDNLTLEHVRTVVEGGSFPMVYRSITNSLTLSLGGATIAISLGALVAYFINRGDWPGRGWLDFLTLIPVAIPGAVISIALLWAYARPPFDFYGTMTIIMIAYITRFLPFGVKAVSASVLQVSEELEKAAFVSGASWMMTFRRILVPLIIPGLLAGWVLLFISMMRELSASIMLYAFNQETLAVALYLTWEDGVFAHVCILALIILFLSLGSIAIVRAMARRGQIGVTA